MVDYMTNLNWKDVNIYYLNLDRRSDRRKAIEKELKRVQLFQNAKRIRGVDGSRLKPKVEKEFLHQGIASRSFERVFALAEHVKVKEATYTDGILAVKLLKEIPEAEKPIEIKVK